jgi:HrpA-like RNA helicase
VGCAHRCVVCGLRSGEAIGQSVGYAIKGESRRSSHTRVLFCTVGVLLRRLQADPSLETVRLTTARGRHGQRWRWVSRVG